MSKQKLTIGRLIRTLIAAVVTVVLGTAFLLGAILLRPEEKTAPAAAAQQTLMPASPARQANDASGLESLTAAFPVPALTLTGTEFVSGTSYDTSFENGFARILDLTYLAAQDCRVTCRTIYPARALSLVPKGDYELEYWNVTLAGKKPVVMKNDTSIRIHVQTADAIYVMTMPAVSDSIMAEILRRAFIPSASEP